MTFYDRGKDPNFEISGEDLIWRLALPVNSKLNEQTLPCEIPAHAAAFAHSGLLLRLRTCGSSNEISLIGVGGDL